MAGLDQDDRESAKTGLSRFQLLCLVGAFGFIMAGLLLFEEPDYRCLFTGVMCVFVLVLGTLLRGIATGALPFRGARYVYSEQPLGYMFALLFYVVMCGLMLVFSVSALLDP